MGLFRKGNTPIIAKLHRTDQVICSHSRERKPPSYSRINTVDVLFLLLAGETKNLIPRLLANPEVFV